MNEDKKMTETEAAASSTQEPKIWQDLNDNGKRALILMPEDAEISEVSQMADVMRRAGINVVIASLDDSEFVRSSSNILCQVDAALSEVLKWPAFDVLVLPGGLLGSSLLGESKVVGDLLREYEEKRRWIIAIGDAPPVLRKHFIGAGKTLTCHPLIKHKIEGSEYMKYTYIDDDVFVDGKIITSKGGPHTIQCALNLVHLLCGRRIAEDVGKKLLIDYDDGYCSNCCGNCKYCCREDKKQIEPDIADRFACATCCSAEDEDVVNWEEATNLSRMLEIETMISCKLRREELKDLEADRRTEEAELEKFIKEDQEELEKLKDKWRSACWVTEENSEKYKREYVEQEEASYDELMKKKYNRQNERHERSKRRQEMVDTFRNLKPAEIDAILAGISRKSNL